MNQLLLIVNIAGQMVALRADDVQSVIELDSLIAVPRAPAHIAGLSALRSRLLTVIDCHFQPRYASGITWTSWPPLNGASRVVFWMQLNDASADPL